MQLDTSQDNKSTATKKAMMGIAVGSVIFFVIIAYAVRDQPSATSTVPTVSATAATPSLADARKEATLIPGRFPAFTPQTGEVKTAAVATPAPPTPAPTAAVRQISHSNAQMMSDPDGSAHHRHVGKLALQVENAVKWSADPDPQTAGNADGAAALEAFYQVAKPSTSVSPSQRSKKARTAPAEPPDKLKEHVRNIVLIDASESFEKEGAETYQAYREAFLTAFDRDERSQAGPEPETSVWDGHIDVVDDYIKGRMSDPDSYRFVGCWKPQPTKVNGQWAWQVKYQFRGKNAFGGVITQTAMVTIRRGEVVGFDELD